MPSENSFLQENAPSSETTVRPVSPERREALRTLGKLTLYGAPLAVLLIPKKAHGYGPTGVPGPSGPPGLTTPGSF